MFSCTDGTIFHHLYLQFAIFHAELLCCLSSGKLMGRPFCGPTKESQCRQGNLTSAPATKHSVYSASSNSGEVPMKMEDTSFVSWPQLN